MDGSIQNKLVMYRAVKAVCDAKPAVWRRSAAFQDAFADFCACIENLSRLQSALDIFHSMAKGIDVEVTVADTILTTEMDELIGLFEPVDVAFVDDYTAAREMEFTDEAAAAAAAEKPVSNLAGGNGNIRPA